jgi:hypothetical protein
MQVNKKKEKNNNEDFINFMPKTINGVKINKENDRVK